MKEENRLRVSENRTSSKIFGSKRSKVKNNWGRLHNEQLYDVYSPNIIRVNKSGRMRWAGHVACMGERKGAYRI